MSSSISTREELLSSARRASGRCWRAVEAQNLISTAKLTDTAAEQRVLEERIEKSKPKIPSECRHLNFLLSTPFRYGAPYPRGSRFRKAGHTPGVFYGAENPDTAIAELCFSRLVFYSESPATRWPPEAGEYTAFAVRYATERAIDLTHPPLNSREAAWTRKMRYNECQELADLARSVEINVIKYASVRDPKAQANIALLTCRAFADTDPVERQTWHIILSSHGARALCEMPRVSLDFDRNAFRGDPRIDRMKWER
ncbi:MAG TPA: RES family NAD+ phosphorylase [Pseudolabrys sp.]|nr:RES family NAD+ phosphorylase [Pseudolabrys sp.]